MRCRSPRVSLGVCATALVAALFVASSPADAFVDPTKLFYEFEAIDGVRSLRSEVVLFSGLELGSDEPIEDLRISFSEGVATRCERAALIMMERPGRYLFQLEFSSEGLGSSSWNCALRIRTE